jgi:hypothetical protein
MTNCPLNLWQKFDPSLAIQLLLRPPHALLTFHRPHRHRNYVNVHGMRDEQRRATGSTKSTVDHGPRISVGVVERSEEVLALGDVELVSGVSTARREGGATGFAAVVAMA